MDNTSNDTSSQQKIVGRKKRLTTSHRRTFDQIFHSDGGYVLDFSDRTMAEWFDETLDIQIFQDRFQSEGTSKGKTLRGFVEVAEPRLVARAMRALWAYRCSLNELVDEDPKRENLLKSWIVQFTRELDELSTINLEEALHDFSNDTSLPKLRASIAADLIAENPDVALDRVHTYCVKRFRSLLSERSIATQRKTPLHSLFGLYGKHLKESELISEFVLPTLRVQHRLFESLNSARNDRSLAHDNQLLAVEEAQFLIESVLASLAFIEKVEQNHKSVEK